MRAFETSIDIITDVDTHSRFVQLAAQRKLPVICQKPMAPTLAEGMVAACRKAGAPRHSLSTRTGAGRCRSASSSVCWTQARSAGRFARGSI